MPPVDPSYLPPDTQIGPYTILGKLGAGGFGVVYRVVRDGQEFALKLSAVKDSELTDAQRQQMELRADGEVSALKSVRHPNIVRVHYFERWPTLTGYPYMVMDLVHGLRFFEWIAKERPNFGRITRTLIKVANALHTIHRIGICHRDLKSANILVQPNDEPMLLDFGIARARNAQTRTAQGALLGTVPCLAPEYCAWWLGGSASKQRFEFKPTLDLYALGAMAYEAVTGADPYPIDANDPDACAEDDMQTMERIRDVVPVPAHVISDKVPVPLSNIIMRLMEKDPGKRYQTGLELAEALAAILGSDLQAIVQPLNAGAGARQLTKSERSPRELDSKEFQLVEAPPSFEVVPDLVPAEGVKPSQALSREVALAAEEDQLQGRPELRMTPVPSGRDSASSGRPSSGVRTPPPQVDSSAGPRTPVSFRDASNSRSNAPSASVPSVEQGFSDLPLSREQAGFNPPTAGQAVPGAPFQGSDSPDGLPSNIRRLQSQLETKPESVGRKNARALLVGVAALALVGLGSLLGRQGRGGENNSLLATVEQGEGAGARVPVERSPAPVEKPAPPLLVPDKPTGEEPGVAGGAAGKPPITKASSTAPGARPGSPAEDVDKLLATTYGRPTVAPDGTVTGQRPSSPNTPAEPSWIQRGTRIDAPVVAAGPQGKNGNAKTYGVTKGTKIRARLMTNLDSRTIGSGPCEAKLVRPFLQRDGTLVFPTGTMLLGTAATNGDRFNVTITSATLPNRTEVQFTGLAWDIAERKPGIPADRRISPPAREGESVAGEIARNAAGAAVNQVTGGIVQEVGRSAGHTIINRAGESAREGQVAQDALLLDLGKDFDVFVTEGF